MEKNLPVRKNIRLKNYNYSSNGAYFITICTENMCKTLGNIVGGGVLDAPRIQLSQYGEVVEKHLLAINSHYDDLNIEKYVIMPNHVHMIILIYNEKEIGASRTPPPTRANEYIPRFISTLKRFVHKDCGFQLFQRGYHERIIRNDAQYLNRWQYIDNNLVKWADDDYYVE